MRTYGIQLSNDNGRTVRIYVREACVTQAILDATAALANAHHELKNLGPWHATGSFTTV